VYTAELLSFSFVLTFGGSGLLLARIISTNHSKLNNYDAMDPVTQGGPIQAL
jgi:hypothetical protein